MIKYIKKDITTVDRGIIAHGVNCQHAMGSGVALAIMIKWPIIRERYMQAPKGSTMLGTVQMINVKEGIDNLFVANCYTQNFFGSGGKFADSHSVEQAMKRVVAHANYYDLPVYLPRIGCGLGGLNWDSDVAPILNELSEQNDRIEIFVCDL